MIVSSTPIRLSHPIDRPLAVSAKAVENGGEESVNDAVTLSATTLRPAADVKGSPTSSLLRSAAQAATDAAGAAVPGPAATTLKVLTLNTYFDARAGVDKMVDLIKTTGADLVGLQEVNLSTKELATKLGMNFVQQDKRTGILSRYPIGPLTANKYGVAVTLPDGQKVGFFNAHTTSFPNQPHQLLHLPIAGGPGIDTEKQAVWWADRTRGREFRNIVGDADKLGLPAIAVGDFNEPSHLDWTQEAADIKRHPIKVDWPGSKTLEAGGFKDSYRVANPDVIAKPGNTWTPTTKIDDPNDHHDRIDFVMYRGDALVLKSSQIVGENTENADIVIDPYPTDHRAVLSTFEVVPAKPKV